MPAREKMCETLKHRQALEFYYLAGEKRTLQAVARRFRVSKNAVGAWSKGFEWRKRILERDRKNSRAIEERADVDFVKAKAEILRMLYSKISSWDETFFGEHVSEEIQRKKIGEFSPSDICGFVRLVFSLTEKGVSPAETREDTRSLDQLSDMELEAIILSGDGKVRPGHFKSLSDAELDEVRSLFKEIRPLFKRVDELTKVAVCAAAKAKQAAAGKQEADLVQ